MSEMDVAIVGAGLSGLVSAILLARHGIQPKVYEQASTLGDVGAGISLAPNASRILEGLGMQDFLECTADQPCANQTRHYKTWELLVDIRRENAREDIGAPYYQMHRADLHAGLLKTLKEIVPDAINLGKSLVSIVHLQNGVRLGFADGSSQEHDVVIAADGGNSATRKALFDIAPAEFLGQVAYRGLVEKSELSDEWQSDTSQNLIGPGAIFLTYPIRQGRIINFVGLAQTDDWIGEGWSTPASASEIIARFEGWHSTVGEIVSSAPTQSLRKWGLFGRKPLENFAQKRVALIGDAAHPMLPFLGMGAAMGIEDGAIVARCLAEIPDPVDALYRYNALRNERANFVQSQSQHAGTRLQGMDPSKIKKGTIRNEDYLELFDYRALELSLKS